MFNSNNFQKELIEEYQKRHPIKEDALLEPLVLKVCSRLIALAFELYEKNSPT